METALPWIIAAPAVVVVVLLIVSITRDIGKAWLDHRVKMALLEKLEEKPELIRSYDELHDLLDPSPSLERLRNRQDYVLTGGILAAIGLFFVVINAAIGSSIYATGAYFGGVACIVLGFLLALLGLLIRYLSNTPIDPEDSIAERLARLIRRNPPHE